MTDAPVPGGELLIGLRLESVGGTIQPLQALAGAQPRGQIVIGETVKPQLTRPGTGIVAQGADAGVPQVDRAADPAGLQVPGTQPVRRGVCRYGAKIELPGYLPATQAAATSGGISNG